MRPIKFRGLSIEPLAKADDWLYGSIIHMNYDDKNAYIDNQEVKFDSVGQYTGLKDKNGREIYEGDIFKNKWEVGHATLHRVYYCDKELAFMISTKFSKDIIIREFLAEYAMDHDIDVIGNIYEDKHLLEV